MHSALLQLNDQYIKLIVSTTRFYSNFTTMRHKNFKEMYGETLDFQYQHKQRW